MWKTPRTGLVTVLTIACASVVVLLGCSKDMSIRYKPDTVSDAIIEIDIHGTPQHDVHDLVP